MLRRAIFGIIYVAVMWFGTSSSETTFRLLNKAINQIKNLDFVVSKIVMISIDKTII